MGDEDLANVSKVSKIQQCAVRFCTGYSALASGLAVQFASRATIQIERSFRAEQLAGKGKRAWQLFLFLFLPCSPPTKEGFRQLAAQPSAQPALQPSPAAYCVALCTINLLKWLTCNEK